MRRPFDWRSFFVEHRIPFIETGPNVKRGEINCRCPWCGSADPSYHLGLNLESGWFSCWRNRAQHSGKSPVRLLMALLRVPYGLAREIAGLDAGYVDPEGFDALAARLMGRAGATGRPEEVRRRRLVMDPSFRPIRDSGATRRAYEYLLEERGFSGASGLGRDVDVLCEEYGLRLGAGDFAGRVVCPYVMDGELVTWTGRAIGASTMRYRDLSRDESIVPPKETLHNHDAMLEGGRVLLVVEGPFDVLKADFYGKGWGVRAVGLSTNSVTDEQAFLLQTAVGRFDRVLVAQDQNASGLGVVDSMRMKQALAFLGDSLGVIPIPFGAKDPGALTPKQAIAWARSL